MLEMAETHKKIGGKQPKFVVLVSSFNSHSRVIEVRGLQVTQLLVAYGEIFQLPIYDSWAGIKLFQTIL